MEVLRHSGHEKLKPKEGTTCFESQEIEVRRSEFKVSLGQSKSQIQEWWHTPLIWATPSAGGLHRMLEEGRLTLHLPALTYQRICWNLRVQKTR